MFVSKHSKLPGTSYSEIIKRTRKEFQKIQSRNPKRQPFVRSRYFNNEKVFIKVFWNHLAQKHGGEQVARAKYYLCALDLIRNTNDDPETMPSSSDKRIVLHRFTGETKNGDVFFVQIKQNKKSGRKDFMSAFPKR